MKRITYEPSAVYVTLDGVKTLRSELLSKRISVKEKRPKQKLKDKKDSSKLFVSAIPTARFKKYKEDVRLENRQLTVIGQTKFKQLSEEEVNVISKSTKAEAALVVNTSDGLTRYFEIQNNYKSSRVVGYLPVGNDLFIAVVSYNPLPIILIIGTIGVIIAGAAFLMQPRVDEPYINRYIEEIDTTDVNIDSSSTRYKLNTTLIVKQSTIQDLNFENVNEGKSLRLKIKLNKEDSGYIYDSGLVPFGTKVTADTLKTTDVAAGTYHTIAECYVYTESEEQIAQTNFEITLIVEY